MRWLYHLALRHEVPAEGAYAPASLAREGFVHASYRDRVAESARLYFAPDADVVVLQIDPRAIDVPLDVAATPRGPMPHLHGPVPRGAIRAVLEIGDLEAAPDVVDDGSTT